MPDGTPRPDTSSGLRIYMLGAPRVEWNGEHVSIPRRQARAMLFYVAAHHHDVPRDDLIFRLWPDLPETTARRNCTRLIASLRAALPCSEIMLPEDDRVRLNPELVWCDLAAFHQHRATPPSPRRHQALQAASEIYRGPFLHGLSIPDSPEFDEWVSQERASLEHAYLDLLTELMETYAVRQDYRAAIAAANEYLNVDNLAEHVHRCLIHYHAGLGDLAAAEEAYEKCRAVMQSELLSEPSQETQAAYRAVLQSRHLSTVGARAEHGDGRSGLVLPFVGRDQAMQTLTTAYAQARARQGGVVLITGEPGSGKSRLVQEFASTMRGVVMMGAGLPTTQSIPYAPVIQALRSLPNRAWLMPDVMHVWLAEIAPLMPELRIAYPGLARPEPGASIQDTGRIFEAFCQLTVVLAGGPHPGLLCLDDLQWADRATLDWITYCTRVFSSRRIHIVASCRSDEIASIADLRHDLRRLGRLTEVKLDGLDATAVVELLRDLEGAMPGDQALATRLRWWSAGNPFFLRETLSALLDSGNLVRDPAHISSLPVPPGVVEALGARLRHLSAIARDVLEVASVLPEPLDLCAPASLMQRPPGDILSALEELANRELLDEIESGFVFRHPILRHAVSGQMSLARRRLLSSAASTDADRTTITPEFP